MGFKQEYNNVDKVKNIDVMSENEIMGFDQKYTNVKEIINLNVSDDEKLYKLIELMNDNTFEKYIALLSLETSKGDINLSEDILGDGKDMVTTRRNILQYLSSGTAVVSFVTALLDIAKVIIG